MTDPSVDWRDDEWRESALCRQVDPELWFPEKGGDGGADAKRICASCPVQAECLEFAVLTGQRAGIWGGVNERTIHKLRVDRGLTRPAHRIPVDRVCALAAEGWSNKQIAAEVGCCADSVRHVLKAHRNEAAA